MHFYCVKLTRVIYNLLVVPYVIITETDKCQLFQILDKSFVQRLENSSENHIPEGAS